MSRFVRLVLLFSLAVAASTCGGDLVGPGDGSGAWLETDSADYSAQLLDGSASDWYRQYGFTVVVHFTNPTAQTVYLGRCYPDSPGPTYGVETIGSSDEWGSAYSPMWACVGHEQQIAVGPGETRTDTLHLRGPNGWDGHTREHFGTLEGPMRLTYRVQACRGDGPACDIEPGRSNTFQVTLEE